MICLEKNISIMSVTGKSNHIVDDQSVKETKISLITNMMHSINLIHVLPNNK